MGNKSLNKLYCFLSGCDNFIFLDTSKSDEHNTNSLLFVNPLQRLQYYEGDDEVEFLNCVQQLKEEGNYIAGWFSYEFGYLLESTLKSRLQKKIIKVRCLPISGYLKTVTGLTIKQVKPIATAEPAGA